MKFSECWVLFITDKFFTFQYFQLFMSNVKIDFNFTFFQKWKSIISINNSLSKFWYACRKLIREFFSFPFRNLIWRIKFNNVCFLSGIEIMMTNRKLELFIPLVLISKSFQHVFFFTSIFVNLFHKRSWYCFAFYFPYSI